MFDTLQKYIVFHPKKLSKDYAFQFDVPFEEYFLKTKDAVTINALFFKQRTPIHKGVVLYFHGNADNLQRWGQYHSDFTSRGYDFFAVDYRGFGKSEGDIEEQKIYDDAILAYQWLREKYPAEKIILYGRSLGSSIASYLAARLPARMLILETPFDTLQGTLDSRKFALKIPFKLAYHFSNEAHLPQVTYPIFIFQGTKDWIVPYGSAAKLKPLLKESDNFFTIKNGKHKNLNTFADYHKNLDNILQ